MSTSAQAAGPSMTRPSRTRAYRQKILDAPYHICVERARYYTQIYEQTEGERPALRAARAFAHTLSQMSIFILPEEAIAGNRSSKLVATVIPVERGEINVVLDLELDAILTRPDRPFSIDPDDRRELEDHILPYWRGKSIRDKKRESWKKEGLFFPVRLNLRSTIDRLRSFGAGALYEQVRGVRGNRRLMARAGEEIPTNNPGLCMNVFDVQGHLVIGHRYLLAEGLEGQARKARERLDRTQDPEERAFLESVIICMEAGRDFAARFAALARRIAASESDPARRDELLAMAKRLDRVPWQPPRDFREAVQFIWLAQVMALISYGVVSVFAVGRLDQYLWPYYRADVEAGRISENEAVELLEELFIKLSCNLLVLPSFGKATGSELGADNQAVTIGGVGADGEDATNPVSYLLIKAASNMGALTNSISFRFSKKSPPAFVEAAIAVHRKNNGPSIFNDDVIVPALIQNGYTPEHARDYALIGCVEPTSDGNTFGCTSGNDVSLAGALEMTLHNGRLLMLGDRVGPETGDPRKFKSFDELLAAYKKQVAACVDIIARATNCKDQAYAQMLPCPYVSATIDGCIDNARDMTQGGARYNFNSISARGLATAADSLIAIKKLVFEDRAVSMAELLKAADKNFRGREKLRLLLKTRPPKFGNDDDEVDALAKDIAEFFCREVMKQRSWRGGVFRPSFFGYGMHVYEGQILGATPDGRRAGEPISNSLSPSNQSEKRGPIAALKSVAKIDHRLASNGASTNVKLMPTLIATDAGLKKVAAMVRAYFREGGQQVQFNVVDDEVLRKAQADPESYKDLVVRVSGYSAYFVDLGRPVQEDIIARCSFDRV